MKVSIFRGKNWKLAGNKKWKSEEYELCGKEKLVGTRDINGTEKSVFRIDEDVYMASSEVTEDEKVVRHTELKAVEPTSKVPEGHGKFYHFSGKNWKLASESKWEENKHIFSGREKCVGKRMLFGQERDVYECLTEEDFIAYIGEI